MSSDVLLNLRSQLSLHLGDNEAEYQALLREWFSGRITRIQIDESVRQLFSFDGVALHNRFMLEIFSHCQNLSNNFEENLCFKPRMATEVLLQSHDEVVPKCDENVNVMTIKRSLSPAVDDKSNIFDDSHSNFCIDPNLVFESPFIPEKPAKFPKFDVENPPVERLPPRKPNFLVKSNSWKVNVERRLPEIPVLETDTLKPKFCSEIGSLLNLETVVGRIYLGLWQSGLSTASEESMLLICRATVDIIKRLIRNLLNLNYDETMSNHLLNVNTATDLSFRAQLQPAKELRSNERHLSAELCSEYSNVSLGLGDMKTLLQMKPELLPLSELRSVAIERCFLST